MIEAAKLKGLKPLSARMMPRDVLTRWNYTFKMLSFALDYRTVYNELTANRAMKMRKYEITDNEWNIVKQLADVLKVSNTFVIIHMPYNSAVFSDIQRCNVIFFLFDTQPCQGDPGNGPHRQASGNGYHVLKIRTVHPSCTFHWQKAPQQVLFLHRSL
jgi:hypothetical protein